MSSNASIKNIYKNMIAVTNRHLVEGDYLDQIRKVIALSPRAMILREKDISHDEYDELLEKVILILNSSEVALFIHSHMDLVSKYKDKYSYLGLHSPYQVLKEKSEEILEMKNQSKIKISVSCHSIDEVRSSASLGADQVILGNIFETDCKKGLPGKGLEFLEEAVLSTTVPVYGIGGITKENLPALLERGAAGGCMMSGFMKMQS